MAVFGFWAVVLGLLLAGAWRLSFSQPLGRRSVRANLTIPVARAALWRAVDPATSDFSFTPGVERRNVRIVGQNPLTVAWESRPAASNQDFRPVVLACLEIEPERKLVSCICWRDGVEAEPEKLPIEVLELFDHPKGVQARITMQYPARGLADLWFYRRAGQKYLKNLRAFALGQKLKIAPMFVFMGWRAFLCFWLALASIPCFAYAFAPSGFSEYGILYFVPMGLAALRCVHEWGHAAAHAALGRRGVIVNLAPFAYRRVLLVRGDFANRFEHGLVALAGPAAGAMLGFMIASMLDPDAGALHIALWALVVMNLTALLPIEDLDGETIFLTFCDHGRRHMAAAAALGLGLIIFAMQGGASFTLLTDLWIFLIVVAIVLLANRPKGEDRPITLAPANFGQKAVLAALTMATAACLLHQGALAFATTGAIAKRAALAYGAGAHPKTADQEEFVPTQK